VIGKKRNPSHSSGKFSGIFGNLAFGRTRQLGVHSLYVVPVFHVFYAIFVSLELLKSLFPRLTKSANHPCACDYDTPLSVCFCKFHL